MEPDFTTENIAFRVTITKDHPDYDWFVAMAKEDIAYWAERRDRELKENLFS